MINGKAYKGVMHFQFNPAAEPNEAIGKLTATGNRSFTFWKHGTTVINRGLQINHNSITTHLFPSVLFLIGTNVTNKLSLVKFPANYHYNLGT